MGASVLIGFTKNREKFLCLRHPTTLLGEHQGSVPESDPMKLFAAHVRGCFPFWRSLDRFQSYCIRFADELRGCSKMSLTCMVGEMFGMQHRLEIDQCQGSQVKSLSKQLEKSG